MIYKNLQLLQFMAAVRYPLG